MARFSMNEMTTYRWSFEEDVERFAALGFDGIGVWRPKLSDFGEERGIDLLHEAGLSVATLMWAGGFTGGDGRGHEDSIDDARDAVRLAGAMKARCLMVYPGSRAGHTQNHARRLLRLALDELLSIADDCDVTLAIEPMHTGCSRDWTFLAALDDTLELLDTVGSPRLKLAFDTYHLGHDERIVARIPELASRVAIVQLGDARCPPNGEQCRTRLGEGTLPLEAIVNAFSQAGYDGFYDIELLGEEFEACDYAELIDHSKRFCDERLGRVLVP